MRRVLAAAVAVTLVAIACLEAQEPPQRNSRGRVRVSPRVEALGEIDGVKIRIDYSSPFKRGRVIWGGLVPWGREWMPGADESTTIVTSGDLMMEALRVPAGEYTLYAEPDPEHFLLIVNMQTGQFHTEYHSRLDLGRVQATARMTAAPVEQMTFVIEPQPAGGGYLKLVWDDREFLVSLRAAQP